MNNLIKHLILFYIGFTSYITIETLFRGYSYALMGVIGAICFILIDKINDYISWDMDLLVQSIIGSAIATLFELIFGLLLLRFDIRMWDYSNNWMNYKGVICLKFSFLWILLSMVAIVFADCINYYILNSGDRPVYNVLKFIRVELPLKHRSCSEAINER